MTPCYVCGHPTNHTHRNKYGETVFTACTGKGKDMTSRTRKPIDMTYHNAVKNREDSSQAGIPEKVGAVTVESDLLPLVQVNAYARIENEHTGRVQYKYIAEAHAFTLNGIDYWRASLYLGTDDPNAYLSWESSSMVRANDDREAPERARSIVMDELRRAIESVRQQPNHAARLRHDAYQQKADEYRKEIADRERRIEHLGELARAELDAR